LLGTMIPLAPFGSVVPSDDVASTRAWRPPVLCTDTIIR